MKRQLTITPQNRDLDPWQMDYHKHKSELEECAKEAENVTNMLLQYDIDECGGRKLYHQMWEDFFQTLRREEEEEEEGEDESPKLSFEE